MNIPGIRISPKPIREQAEVGKSAERCGMTSLIGISRPVATTTITLYPPLVKYGLKNTQKIS